MQNLKRLVRFLAQRPPKLEPQVGCREMSEGKDGKKKIGQLQDLNNPFCRFLKRSYGSVILFQLHEAEQARRDVGVE